MSENITEYKKRCVKLCVYFHSYINYGHRTFACEMKWNEHTQTRIQKMRILSSCFVQYFSQWIQRTRWKKTAKLLRLLSRWLQRNAERLLFIYISWSFECQFKRRRKKRRSYNCPLVHMQAQQKNRTIERCKQCEVKKKREKKYTQRER